MGVTCSVTMATVTGVWQTQSTVVTPTVRRFKGRHAHTHPEIITKDVRRL